MNPDQGVIGGFFTGGIGEQLIDVLEVFPVGTFVGEMFWKGMQNGPEGFFGGDVVKILDPVCRQGNTANDGPVTPAFHGYPVIKVILLFGGDLLPGYPGAALGIGKKAFQGWHNAVGAFLFAVNGGAVFLDFVVGFPVVENH
jgi:hypothetical protein